ncbi:MAG: DUF5683 domain-containing protein [Proteiniphilum sp.]|jgi:hypothetical protein|nr:DUF5683 domain-containing protein [Proteiniphilum sp.]
MMNMPGFLFCLSMLFCVADLRAQNHSPEQLRDTVPATVRDSVPPQAPDTVPMNPDSSKDEAKIQDSVRPETAPSLALAGITSDKFLAPACVFSPSPRKAILYAAIFPGLGQAYNRKYWKLPIIYGGIAGLTYAISWNNGYYQDYLGAYKDIRDDNPDTNRWHKVLPYGQNPELIDIPWFTNVLQQRKDRYRYYKDLSIIITVGVYFLSIIDAYVDAQLFNFDMSPDLSMRITPAVIREEGKYNQGGSSYGVQWSFNF